MLTTSLHDGPLHIADCLRPKGARSMLHTRICDLFGIEVPILNAPMGTVANGELAAAVSNAGGLGLIGSYSIRGPEWLREQIRLARERTERPFGVGFVTHWLPAMPGLYQVALDERVPVIAHSFADPAPYMDGAKGIGARVMCQVRDPDGAREAARAGVDVVVAQGTEAGGHTGEIATLPLVPQVVDAVAPLPVIAAGGIADGRGLAAALMLGAEGAWLGTAFLVSPESRYWATWKEKVLEAGAGDTVRSEVFDIAHNRGAWPQGVAGRAVRNRFSDRWHGREEELRRRLDEVGPEYRAGDRSGDLAIAAVWAGEAVGLVTKPEPAGEVVRRIAAEAERVVTERSRALSARTR